MKNLPPQLNKDRKCCEKFHQVKNESLDFINAECMCTCHSSPTPVIDDREKYDCSLYHPVGNLCSNPDCTGGMGLSPEPQKVEEVGIEKIYPKLSNKDYSLEVAGATRSELVRIRQAEYERGRQAEQDRIIKIIKHIPVLNSKRASFRDDILSSLTKK